MGWFNSSPRQLLQRMIFLTAQILHTVQLELCSYGAMLASASLGTPSLRTRVTLSPFTLPMLPIASSKLNIKPKK